ncbi:PDZ domain-containing protein [Apilactobacillus apisilvae]|uniref:PDZ domain-containing protein n=1 Tax=Apilactobacillus apisilvae TaxID=2923364 RepID=A0ABY4PHE4_9LACO|nr:PDZ domain-containing protein [Apilactobacillus apisilvae]UQS85075.1 PDZ domain-containing protein [Apilactobacillus apisilvae]
MSYIIIISSILIQPVLWLGVIKTYLNYRKRISRERNNFNTSIYQNNFEIKHFIISFFILGTIGSIISAFIGTFIPNIWIFIYEVLLLLNLLLVPNKVYPIFMAGLTTVVMIVIDLFNLLDNQWDFPVNMSMTDNRNILFLLSLIILLSGIFFRFFIGKYNTPEVFRNKRGNKVAGYVLNEISVIPLLVLVPGDQIHKLISFWPVFNFNNQSFTLFFLPVLLGIKINIFKNVPRELSIKLGNNVIKISVLGFVFTIISYFLPIVTLYLLAILIFIYLGSIVWIKNYDRNSKKWFSDAVNGLRVIGVRPNTPATKMNVQIGDLIIEVNNQKVHNDSEFYEAILSSPTFCRLKIVNRNDRIKITESAIYNDSPNELGVVLFKDN